MFAEILLDFILLGIIGALLAIFYRNCLTIDGMIFYPFYKKVLEKWMNGNNSFLSWIAMPLGGCVYCNSFWTTFLVILIYLNSWTEGLSTEDIILGIIAAEGVQHLLIAIICRWIIYRHPDLDVFIPPAVITKNTIGYINNSNTQENGQ